MLSPAGAWLRPCEPGDAPEFDILTLPHAGGNGMGQRGLATALGAHFAVTAVQYPGRLDRVREAPITDVASAGEAIAAEWRPSDRRLVVLGTSMGALLAFEVVRHLENAGNDVELLVVAGSRPPGTWEQGTSRLINELESDGIAALVSLTGLSAEVLQYPEMVELLLPVLKAEVSAADRYLPPHNARVNCPVLSVLGSDDLLVTADTGHHWGEFTESTVEHLVIPGGHILCEEDPLALAELLKQRLSFSLVGRVGG